MERQALNPARQAAIPGSLGTSQTLMLQRKCACGGAKTSVGECDECKKKKLLQRKRGDGAEPRTAPPIVDEVLRSAGQPLDTGVRAAMEPRMHHDFANVRVHADEQAAQSANAVNALAYTVGSQVVFAAGQYAPQTASGRRLIAHELTHVVQQRRASAAPVQAKLQIGRSDDAAEREADRSADEITDSKKEFSNPAMPVPIPPPSAGADTKLRRAAAPSNVAATPATQPGAALIVEDDATELSPGQMRKTEFLDGLRAHVCNVADTVLSAVGRTAVGCPFIERWINHLRARTSQHVERGIRKYAPEGASATTARDYYAAVGERVRQGVTRWASSGEISGVPPDLMSEMGGGGITGILGGIASGIGSALAGVGRLFTKPNDRGAREGNPVAIQAQLRANNSSGMLDAGVRTRMETAFGHSFSRVRVHTGSRAEQLSSGLQARAFTIGNDVAFAAGEYRPGTVIGDALIAHELAHVVQQGNGTHPRQPMANNGTEHSSLEEDADISAVRAMLSSWGKTRTAFRTMGASALPRLRSGLKLQRCGGSNPPARSAIAAEAVSVDWSRDTTCTPAVQSQISGLLGQALPTVRSAVGRLASPAGVQTQLMNNFRLRPDDPRVGTVTQVLQGVVESMESVAQSQGSQGARTAGLGTIPAFMCGPCADEVHAATTNGCANPSAILIQFCVQNGTLAASNPVRTIIHEFVHASCGRTRASMSDPRYIQQGVGVEIFAGPGERQYQQPQPDPAINLKSAYAHAQFAMDAS